MKIITVFRPCHRLKWCSVKMIDFFFLYFLKLNLIFHSIRFRFIFVFRVIILLDEIFSSLFESSHFIIIKIVVDFLYFIILKEADDTCYGISSFQWFIPERVRFDANLRRKKALLPSFAGKALKVATDVCITICRGPDFHHRSILANFARKHRRLWVVDF